VPESLKIIAVCGKSGAGKDTFYEHVLRPRGVLRWQMILPYEVWLAAAGRYDWDDIFYHKPTDLRQTLRQEVTALRAIHSEAIWLRTFEAWLRVLFEVVGVHCAYVAVTDVRFVIEVRGIKAMEGKILHLEAPDQQANVAPELRGHRSEVELDSPEVLKLRDDYIFNEKIGIDRLKYKGERMLEDWGWL
jgi:hypothetical protein